MTRARWASSTAARISATLYWATPMLVPGVMRPPVDMILRQFAPDFELASGGGADGRFAVGLESQEVAVAACNGDRRAGRQNARPGDQPTGDGVPQAKGHAAATAQVAHGGDAGAERLAGRRNAAQQELLVVLDQQIAQWIRGVAEDEVDVAVEQPGQDRQIHSDPAPPRRLASHPPGQCR